MKKSLLIVCLVTFGVLSLKVLVRADFFDDVGEFFGAAVETIKGKGEKVQAPIRSAIAPPRPELRYNDATFLVSHNSYSSTKHGYKIYYQQRFSIWDQMMQFGVRGLMLDTYPGVSGDLVSLCHSNTGKCGGEMSFLKDPVSGVIDTIGETKTDYLSFKDALIMVKKFLDQNPKEVITIFLENYAKNENINKVIRSVSGLTNMILTPKDWDPDLYYDDWPTIAWMLAKNKRLVIFNDTKSMKDSDGLKTQKPDDLFYFMWRYVIESNYGEVTADKICVERGSSKDFTKVNKYRKLLLINAFPTISSEGVALISKFLSKNIQTSETTNSKPNLQKIVELCKSKPFTNKQMPNFIALDFIGIGLSVFYVQEINKQAKSASTVESTRAWYKRLEDK